MKTKTLALFSAVTLFAALGTTVQTFAQKTKDQIITFDASGAGISSGQGTVPRSINPSGEITGEFYDNNVATHGFVRAADGTVTTFDVPGANTGNGQGTYTI
jgi:hypothetical protein